MPTFAQRLKAELDSVPVVDPHTHLRPERPQADHLADLVLYHHLWIELVSAGMPVTATTRTGLPHELADPDMEPLDRVKAALPYLPHLRSTTCGGLLRTILQDLYQVPDGALTEANLDRVFALVAERAADPAWRLHVMRDRCHILKSLTVGGYEHTPCDATIGKGQEGVPTNLVNGKQGPRDSLHSIAARLGRELRRAEDYGEGMYALGQDYSRLPLHFAGLWLLPQFSYAGHTEHQVSAAIERAAENRPLSPQDLSAFACYGVRSFLQGLRTGPLRTIQLIVGAEVLPPHRSITQWSPELPGGLARLAGDFEDMHFNCSSASDLYTQDLAILAKHVPNISVAGYWWHALYPFYIRKTIETRLDTVPANKIVAFFSDAYHAEWCYPKLKLVKGICAEVLLDRVRRGLYTEEIALSLVKQTFCDNPKRIYRIE
jgi:glucuronate isomerase